MSLELERAAVAKHFKEVAWNTAWGDPEKVIAWPNKEFMTPANHLFVIFSIVDRGTIRRSIGFDFFKRRNASIQVDIYSPLNQGTKQSRQMVDVWEGLYEMLTLNLSDGEALVFGTPSSRVLDPNVIRAGNLDDNWDRYVFEAPYHRDQHVEK